MQLALVALLEDVLFLFLVVELARRRIECDGDLLAGLVAGQLDGFENQLDGFAVRLERRSKSALVANRRVVSLLLQHALQRVEGLRRPAQRLAEALRAHGHDHEFLKVHVRVGVRAAVQHVQHRSGQHAGIHSAQIAIQRDFKRLRHGARGGHRYRQNRIRAQLAFVRRSIQRNHRLVDQPLVRRIHPFQFRRNHRLHVRYGLQHALAEVVALVAVAQLHGLMLAR